MKSRKIVVIVLSLICSALFAVAMLTACSPQKATLVGIAVTTPPTKTTYTAGEIFSKDGMVVTATYSDDTAKAVTDYSYSPDGALTEADSAITITYREGDVTRTATQAITVNPAQVAATLESIAVTTPPTRVEYFAGESFERAGMVVTATYSDTTTKVVSTYTVSPAGALAVGTSEVTVSYTEGGITRTATQPITVKDAVSFCTLKIEAEAADSNAQIYNDAGSGGGYRGGMNFERYVRFWVRSSAAEDIEVRLSICISSEQAAGGNQHTTFDKLYMFTLNGEAVDMSAIRVDPISDLANSPQGDYNDFREVDVNITLKPGDNELLFNSAFGGDGYHGTNFDYIMIVASEEVTQSPAPVLKSLLVEGAKTEYYTGQSFDTSTLVVKAHYDYGADKVVTEYTCSPDGPLSVGDTTVTISYTEGTVTKTAEITVTVSEVSVTSLSIEGAKTVYMEYDKFTTDGMVVTAHYSDGGSGVIDDGYTVDKTGPLSTSDTKVTVSYADVTAEVTIEVKPYAGTAYTIIPEDASMTEINPASPEKEFVEEHHYIGGVPQRGNMEYGFYSSANQKILVSVILAGNEAGDMLLRDMFYIKINGVDFAYTLDTLVPNPDHIAYYYFVRVSFPLEVNVGDNTIAFESNAGSGTNFSGIVLTPADDTTEITAPTGIARSTERFEAENATLAGISSDAHVEGHVGDDDAFVRGNSAASEGKYVGNMSVAGNSITFTVHSSVACKATLVICVASVYGKPNATVRLVDAYALTLNGNAVAGYEEAMAIPTEGTSESYNDFVRVTLTVDLTKGDNVFAFIATTLANNFDYIELEAASELTWNPVENKFKTND